MWRHYFVFRNTGILDLPTSSDLGHCESQVSLSTLSPEKWFPFDGDLRAILNTVIANTENISHFMEQNPILQPIGMQWDINLH